MFGRSGRRIAADESSGRRQHGIQPRDAIAAPRSLRRRRQHCTLCPTVDISAHPTVRRIPGAAIVAIAASAGLLFAMEPFAAKVLLPRLGGTPSVWNTCVMVFQLLLLAGYGYSVMLVRMANVRHA